ncbi:MAG TPA: SDR family NAD(P)-dependent oxidoreductase [Candidatus Binatia bacterium]|nr:SDR family NAD(P)-dependent oxidoreductase [Candidatus Binatia bacterium]
MDDGGVIPAAPRAALDALLELAIVPSFSAIGLRVRRRLWSWADPEPAALDGRTALVTGATGGLGRAAANALAGLGARVVLVGRDLDRLEQLRSELVAATGGAHGAERFPVHVADMSDIGSARRLAQAVVAAETSLDIVVDNAGMIYPERTTAADGSEASMALMALAPFALVSGLLPLLRRSGDARVIAVTSGGMYTTALDVRDLDGTSLVYNGPRFYARAKRAQVALVREWARRLRGSSITVVAMHPGWARTPGLSASLPGFDRLMAPILRTPAEGVDTITWLATVEASRLEPGCLYLDRRPRPFDRLPWTPLRAAERRALWAEAVERCGGSDPFGA